MILSDEWWEKVSYIIYFTRPIYEMIRFCDTDKPSLHLIYEMWDSMIEKVKYEIYKKEKRPLIEVSPFYKYEWLSEDSARLGPHRDPDVSSERMKCFRRLFPSTDYHLKVIDEYALFSMRTGLCKDLTCISVMFTMEPKKWWANFGAKFLFYRLWLLSCLDSLVHLMCSALRFLSRNSEQYEEEKTKMWDVGGDDFYSMEDVGYLEFANLSLDEPDLENRSIND
uniref:HAT C-terminal dimerisation domain-containing protein n=1 Tax=Brassica oleracea var. oleracea TaxID=109376 RepID=A0A0D3AD77_BRAOL